MQESGKNECQPDALIPWAIQALEGHAALEDLLRHLDDQPTIDEIEAELVADLLLETSG